MSDRCDVLVVGLGPVGLLLCALLEREGLDVVGIDRLETPPDLPRAAVLDDAALVALRSAGVAEEVVRGGVVQERAELRLRRGRTVTLMEFPPRTASGFPACVGIHQPTVERLLADAVGVPLRRGVALSALRTGPTGAEARVGDGALSARFVVGCDGGSSTVRRLLGVPFGGTTFAQRWLVVDAAVESPVRTVVTFTGDPRAPAVTLALTPARRRWEVMVAGDPPPGLAQRLAGPEAEVLRSAVYTFHARTAARWRVGSALLAGDAAHLMPPFAGQGLGSGLRDAACLAPTLAAVVRGELHDAALDRYERERRPQTVRTAALARFVGALVQTRRPRVAGVRDAALLGLDATPLAGALRSGARLLSASA